MIEHAEGCYLFDTMGNKYLDGVSSLWCNVHGHSEPSLVAALKDQTEKLCHSTLLGLSHTPILELACELKNWLPESLSRYFFCDSGTTAVEASLRIALEWWQNNSSPTAKKKTRLLSLASSYHGDTLGAVSVGFLRSFHDALDPIVTEAIRLPPPHIIRLEEQVPQQVAQEKSLRKLAEILAKEADSIAAFIIEPLVQGAAGIWPHSEEFLRDAIELCRKNDVLVITDEVATGFGKTGNMFAIERAAVEPDMLVLGKGLSGGYLPISAVAAKEELFQGFLGEPQDGKTFYYGQTFAGNPLAARVSRANLELFRSASTLEKLPLKIKILSEALENQIKPLASVFEVRQSGVMVGIELTETPGVFRAFPDEAGINRKIALEAKKRGAFIRPLGNVMVLMPALAMSESQLKELVQITSKSISSVLPQ